MTIAQSLDIVKSKVEEVVSLGEELQNQITDRVDELESLRERSDNINADVQSYLDNLEGLQSSLDDFENVRDEATSYQIEVY